MNNQLQTPAAKKLDGTKERALYVGLVLRQRMCWGITTGTETEPDGPTSEVLTSRPGWSASDRDSSEKGIGGVALMVIEKGDCDGYNSPDHGTPYAAKGHGFR